MCGIIGTYRGNIESIKDATSLLSHRGPDDNGVFLDSFSKVALGHQRLSIIDTSSLGHQPMISNDGEVVIVFNGEIYNYQTLREDLEKAGCKFLGNSDTEVLLNLYLLEGKKMLTKLNKEIIRIIDKNLLLLMDSNCNL